MPVAVEELEGSPTMRQTLDGFTATRVLRIAWNDWPALVAELWGSYRLVGATFVYTPPAPFPGVSGAVATDVRIEPFDPGHPVGPAVLTSTTGLNSYPSGARVTVTYEPLWSLTGGRNDLPNVPSGTILLFQADLSSELERAEARHFRWDVAGSPMVDDDTALPILVPTDELRLSWQRVPSPPWSAIVDLRGKLNASTFVGYPAETLIFLGARVRRDFQFIDTGLWRLDYFFKARTVTSTANGTTKLGWNHRWRGAAFGGEHWLRVVDDGNRRLYATGDFDGLFAFG
ncbi:MAG: hypothetical protein K1X74_00540 [Pirellulales bacterium]|nr:hypothetical protein [Pirellulales bacterium]